VSVEESKTLSARTISILNSMRMIRAFGQEQRELERFAELSESERSAYLRTDATIAAVAPLMEVLYVPLL
jgi:ABC-type multidrug transport system fused ATPase/permease subunit